MGGKTRVFGKKRVFSTKPGFPGRTSVLLANPGYFKGLEAQGIYTYPSRQTTLLKAVSLTTFVFGNPPPKKINLSYHVQFLCFFGKHSKRSVAQRNLTTKGPVILR